MSKTIKPQRTANRLANYIKNGEVLTSSELIALLRKDGSNEANARQIISRSSNSDGIWRSEQLRLPRDERLFAEKSFVGTPGFVAAAGEKLGKTSRKGLARCLSALSEHRVLHKIDVARLLAVSLSAEELSGARRGSLYQDELDAICELGAKVIQPNTALESIALPGKTEDGEVDAIANLASQRLRYEVLLTRILNERLRRQNMVSWNRIDMPEVDKPYTVFNGQLFSAYAFSYLSPIVRWKENAAQPTPCPVLIDCYQGVCNLAQVESFLQRIDRATIRRKNRTPSLGIIAARDFSRDAWTLARRSGLMSVSFRQMFGDEALDAMVEVEKLLYGLVHEPTANGSQRFKTITGLIDDLKMNPVVVDLRSIGLEALTGLILRSEGYERLELGRIVPWKKTTRDVDVYGLLGDHLKVIECKAYHRKKSLLEEDVRKFFTQTLPALKKWMRDTNRLFTACTAEIWTTGPLGNPARDELYQLAKPNGDTWSLVRMEDMYDRIPVGIRERSVKLLDSIALAETDGSDN